MRSVLVCLSTCTLRRTCIRVYVRFCAYVLLCMCVSFFFGVQPLLARTGWIHEALQGFWSRGRTGRIAPTQADAGLMAHTFELERSRQPVLSPCATRICIVMYIYPWVYVPSCMTDMPCWEDEGGGMEAWSRARSLERAHTHDLPQSRLHDPFQGRQTPCSRSTRPCSTRSPAVYKALNCDEESDEPARDSTHPHA